MEIANWLYSFGGIDIHHDNDEVFRWSCGLGQLEVAQWLYSLGNVDIHARKDFAFRSSCANGNLHIAKWLYSFGGIDIYNCKVMRAAISHGHNDVIEWFFSLKPN